MDIATGLEQRSEEAEALDVVHVEMGEKDVDPARNARDDSAQGPDARASVQDDERGVLRFEGHAGRVAAVPDRRRPGGRQGSAVPQKVTLTDRPLARRSQPRRADGRPGPRAVWR